MTTPFNPRLLIPPEEEEIYPYRRVWRSVGIEGGILLLIALGLFILVTLLGADIPVNLHRPVNILLAFLPLALWLVFSLLQERFVPEPRGRLIVVLVISALAANAVGIPLVNEFLQVDRWLPLSSALTRILGYTFTVGIVQEVIKYLVLRYSIWPECLRIRMDGVAYSIAAAVGYATVLNMHFVLTSAAPPDTAAMRIFDIVALHYATSVLVGYGLAEVRFGQPSPLLLTFTLAAAATLTGIAIPVRAGLVNAGLTLGHSAASPIRGLALSAILLVGIALVVGFLIENTERQAREAAQGRGH